MKKILLLVICCISLSQYVSSQSGWVRGKNNFYIKPDFTFYKSAEYYNINSSLQPTSPFTQKTYSVYFEYGLSNNVAVNGYIPVLKQNSYGNTGQKSGVGDLKFELKYAVQKGKFPVALIFAPEFPTGNKSLYAKIKSNPLDSINLATGDGDFNFFTTLAASHSFYPKPFYVSGFGSYNWRAKFNDQVLAGVEAGYKVKDKLWLITKLSVLTGIGERPAVADFIKNDGASNTSFITTALYEVGKHWGVGFQYQNNNSLVIKLRNSYAANNFSFYLTYNKKR